MNLQQIPDTILLQQADSLAQQERECMTALLHHIREINARRLYSALQFTSIHDYVVRRLKFPKDQAYRRVSAMWLLEELPQIEEKITSGSLTLTNLNLAQGLFRREKSYSKKAKFDLILKLENKSSREAEREIAKISPEPPREKVRVISETNVELRAVLSHETLQKLERLKGLLAHSCPDITFGELIDKLADEGLKAWDKTAAPRGKVRRSRPSKNPSYVPRHIYRMVWSRDKCCQVCGSYHALEIDHRVPAGLGGTSEPDNLRLLCRHCNQRAAIEVYGQQKMTSFLKGPTVLSAVKSVPEQ